MTLDLFLLQLFTGLALGSIYVLVALGLSLIFGLLTIVNFAHGQFFIGALQPGVYQIELERDNLPIELVPRLARLNAQVGGAAVTRVDFIVRPEFGAAGRVVGPDGAPIAGLALELLDGARVVVERTVTDAFGLYRMDGLPVGSYLLRVAPGARGVSGEPASSRIVNIADDFVFGQDLVLATGDES